MAQATPAYSRFDNLSNEALADAIGQADAILKGAEAECKALKDEFKSRGLLTAAGEHFTITRSDQVSSRLDVAAVQQFHGDAWRRFDGQNRCMKLSSSTGALHGPVIFGPVPPVMALTQHEVCRSELRSR